MSTQQTETSEMHVTLSPEEVFKAGRAASAEGYDSLQDFVRAAVLEKLEQVTEAPAKASA